ncbi:hypothetical protein MMC25_002515 [Agyrium rufum]|nr:hypothetical protein [Agyrium rufum]
MEEIPQAITKRLPSKMEDSTGDRSCKRVKIGERGSEAVHNRSIGTQTIDAARINPPHDDGAEMALAPMSTRSTTPAYAATVAIPVKNKGGRPRKPPQPPKARQRLPNLTSRNPVATTVPVDVWRSIFSFCPLEFLPECRRICKTFDLALSYEATWREARERAFGAECPPPPKGMKEQHYANLLTGVGCQALTNGERCPQQARKTYWAFQKRLCVDHLRARTTILPASLTTSNIVIEDFIRLISSANFDSWESYLSIGGANSDTAWQRCPTYKRVYEKSEIEAVAAEIQDLVKVWSSEEEIKAWFETRASEKSARLEELRKVETWVETTRKVHYVKSITIAEERSKFYIEKAAQMDPPLLHRALKNCLSYNHAIAIRKSPSERSWTILEAKLKEERDYAELIAELDDDEGWEAMSRCHYGSPPRSSLQRVSIVAVSEGILKEHIVKSSMDHVDTEPCEVEDENLVAYLLWKFKERYDQLSPPTTIENDEAEYRELTLGQAQAMYEQVVDKYIRSWPDKDRVRAASQLRCPLCPHKEKGTKRRFRELMLHIGYKHARQTKGFQNWRPAMYHANSFPWHSAPWPANLPILAKGEKPGSTWDLNNYVLLESKPPLISFTTPSPLSSSSPTDTISSPASAFEGRKAADNLDDDPLAFCNNVIAVVKRFEDATTLLPTKYIGQITFRYAIERYENADASSKEPVIQLGDGRMALNFMWKMIDSEYEKYFSGFKCKFCCDQPHPTRYQSRFTKRALDLQQLINHFTACMDHISLDWTKDIFSWAKEEELAVELGKEGMEGAKEIFEKVFPKVVGNDLLIKPE